MAVSTDRRTMKIPTVVMRSGKAGRVRPGHPWIFRDQIAKAGTDEIVPGSLVKVSDGINKIIGTGYFNPHSEILVRLLTFDDSAIDQGFFDKRVGDAFGKRQALKTVTNGYRVIFSEADGLTGLIADLYNDTLVFSIQTLGMERLKELALDSIRRIVAPKFIFEKSEGVFRKKEGLKDAMGWIGDRGKTTPEIFEGKARFLIDIVRGHKTGFYLDQRKARLAIEPFSKGKRVLDLFTYAGGFAIHAALGGAASVTAIDINDKWLQEAAKNAGLSGVGGRIEFKRGDTFKTLDGYAAANEHFDIVVLDPPSFLRSKRNIESATRGYSELNAKAMSILNDGGILATFSCSHNMSNTNFAEMIKGAAKEAGKAVMILKRCHQSEDHPIVRDIPETEYLKGYFLKVKAG